MTSAIVNHLWQSTVVVLAAAGVAYALRHHQARVRHAVWLTASLKFLLPFSLLIALGGSLSWRTSPVTADSTTPVFAATVQTITEPFAASPVATTRTIGAEPTRLVRWSVVLASLWIVGSVVVIAMRVRGWLTIRAALRASTPSTLPDVDGDVRVRASSGLLEPGVVGVWRPVLLVPVGLDALLTGDQLRAVVAHELQHIRRRDNLTSALHMAVEAVFWFHPLVWWIGARLVEERERACDEHVVAGGAEPDAYAEAILSVCKRYVEVPVACVSGVTGSDLKKRLNTILGGRVGAGLSTWRKVAVVCAAVLALAAPMAAGVITAPVRATQQPATSVRIPKFDVVSVRPCAADAPFQSRSGGPPITSPGRLYYQCFPLAVMVHEAYIDFAGGRYHRTGSALVGIEGEPGWMTSDRFTIEAKTDQTPAAALMRGPMLQALLEDRFKLQVRRETRQMPVYELVTAGSGAKVSPYAGRDCVIQDDAIWPPVPPPPGQSYCRTSVKVDGESITRSGVITLDLLADLFSFDHPVVNRTGITAPVSIDLRYPKPGVGEDQGPPPAALVRALRDQLGLDLRPAKGPRDFFVVEHVERPGADSDSSIAAPQVPASLPKLEAVSVRPCGPNDPGSGRSSAAGDASPGRMHLGCYSVLRMIQTAYVTYAGGRPHALSEQPFAPLPNELVQLGADHTGAQGVPDWLSRDRFTIEAKAEADVPSLVMIGPMLQQILEDRFKVRVHRETREIPVYDLVVAPGGLKIAPAPPGACVPYDLTVSPQPPLQAGQHRCENSNERTADGGYRYNYEATTLDAFAAEWSRGWIVDRPIVNTTGLTGTYTFVVVQAGHTTGADEARAAMIAEFRNRLGLELRPGTGRHEFLIVDHVERPTIDSGGLPK